MVGTLPLRPACRRSIVCPYAPQWPSRPDPRRARRRHPRRRLGTNPQPCRPRDGHHLPRKAVVHLQAVLADVEATGKADEVVRVAASGRQGTSVVVTGLGEGASRRSTYAHTACARPPAARCAASGASARRPRPADADLRACRPWPTARTPGATPTTSPPLAVRRGPARGPPPPPRRRPTVPARACWSCPVRGRAGGQGAVARAAMLGAARTARDLVNLRPTCFPAVVRRQREEEGRGLPREGHRVGARRQGARQGRVRARRRRRRRAGLVEPAADRDDGAVRPVRTEEARVALVGKGGSLRLRCT